MRSIYLSFSITIKENYFFPFDISKDIWNCTAKKERKPKICLTSLLHYKRAYRERSTLTNTVHAFPSSACACHCYHQQLQQFHISEQTEKHPCIFQFIFNHKGRSRQDCVTGTCSIDCIYLTGYFNPNLYVNCSPLEKTSLWEFCSPEMYCLLC